MHKGICKICGNEVWGLNSKDICPGCVYKKNHEGKSRFEIQLEKVKFKKPKRIKRSKKSIEKRKEVLQKDQELYEYWFNTKSHYCEECHNPLPKKFKNDLGEINAIWQYSHIISKGSRPRLRHHKLNGNRLCFTCHQRWEFGTKEEKMKMKIWEKNQKLIEKMMNDE
jgi:hypothetical protein